MGATMPLLAFTFQPLNCADGHFHLR
jgi:hypothetical protein